MQKWKFHDPRVPIIISLFGLPPLYSIVAIFSPEMSAPIEGAIGPALMRGVSAFVVAIATLPILYFTSTARPFLRKKHKLSLVEQQYFIDKRHYLKIAFGLLFVILSIIILVTILEIISVENKPQPSAGVTWEVRIPLGLIPGFFFPFYISMYQLLDHTRDPKFWHAFSYSCFVVAKEKSDIQLRMKYLIYGTDAYNVYLKRRLGVKLALTNRIYEKALTEYDDEFVTNFSGSFTKKDPLEPLKFLKTVFAEELITKERVTDKIKEWILYAASVISGVAVIVQFIIPLIIGRSS